MNKRGQLTIFILIAILIVTAVSSVFILRDSLIFTKIPKNAEPIYNSFFYCLEETGDIATLVVLAQGGTYEKGNLSKFNIYKLAKPISKNDSLKEIERNEGYGFTKENLGNSIEEFIKDSFNYCIDSVDFTRFDQEVVFDKFDINVDVKNKFIIMNLDFPIIVNKGNVSLYMENFVYRKKIDMGTMEDVVNKIVDESVKLNFPPYDLMDNLERKHGLDIDVEFVFEELAIENIIYSIKFEEENQLVVFDIHYDWYNI
jgi:hypothetical protein